jgi:hypothetical protein
MSGLAALLAGHTPPDVYQWHSAAPAPDVQHAVEKAGWDFRYLDGWTIEDQATFVKSAAECLDTSVDGSDVDALTQCLGKIQPNQHGMVLLWDGWSPLARHDEETFRAAVRAFRSRAELPSQPGFAVILRGEGPDLDLEELPIKH